MKDINITNIILADNPKGELLAYFDLQIDCINIDNCMLFLNTINKNFYWKTYPHEYKCRYKFSDKTTYRNYVQITDKDVSKQVLKLAQKEYYKVKSKADVAKYETMELQNANAKQKANDSFVPRLARVLID